MAIARDLDSKKEKNVVMATRNAAVRSAGKWFIIRLLLFVGLCIICVIGTFGFQVALSN